MRLLRRKEGCMMLSRRRYMGKVNGIIPASSYIQDGLIAMYDGIENAGAGQHSDSATTWKDLSGNGWDLALVGNGSSSWQDDHYNFVAVSNTGGKRFTVDATDMSSVLTLEFCLQATGNIQLIHFRNDFNFYIDGRNGGYAYTGINTVKAAKAFPFGKVSGSIDIGNNIMYRNNELCAAQSQGRQSCSANQELILGCLLYNGYRFYTSFKLHTIRLYNRVLTADERTHNYELDVQRFGLETT